MKFLYSCYYSQIMKEFEIMVLGVDVLPVETMGREMVKAIKTYFSTYEYVPTTEISHSHDSLVDSLSEAGQHLIIEIFTYNIK